MKKLFLFLTFLFAAFAANAQNTYLKGDMNDDGILDVTDIMIIVNKILSGENTSVEQQSYLTCPDDHHPHMIDLGLPSGTKWACCNVDTDNPENQSPTNYGGYYAWGETSTKDLYYYEQDGILLNIGSNICGTKYDVAHVKWGDAWQMPTHDQIVELNDNVIFWSTEINGVYGGLFTSIINGASIFLPYADYYARDYPAEYNGTYGYYWTGTLDPGGSPLQGIFTAYCLLIYATEGWSWETRIEGNTMVSSFGRPCGLTVRPVWIGQ